MKRKFGSWITIVCLPLLLASCGERGSQGGNGNVPTVMLEDGVPDKTSVDIMSGGKLTFKSQDGEAFTIDFGEDNAALSDQLPLSVPANGRATLKFKNNIEKKTYQYVVKNASGAQVWPDAGSGPGDVPPSVIIR